MANYDGKVVISTKLDNSKIDKGVSELSGKLGGLKFVVRKLGTAIAVAFSVKAIASFAKECLDLGSNLQEVQNVVDVTFTTMNGQVNAFAKNAMKTAGLSETMAKQYTGAFGAMAKSFGFTEEEAYGMSASLTQLTGDVASFYNLSQDAAYTKLKSVFTGETESLKDLGVVMTQSALDAFALEKGFGKTTQQMTEQEKVALRYQFVMEQLSAASGDFQRTSGSWANQTRLLTLQFDQLKATIGQGLIVALTPAIQILNELIGYLQIAANAFSSFMQAIFGASGGSSALESDGAGIAAAAGAAASSSDTLAENAESAAKSAAKIKKSLAGFDEINILSAPAGESSGGGASTGGASFGTITAPTPPDLSNTDSTVDIIKQKLGELKTELLEFANITGFSNLWDSFLLGAQNAYTGVGNVFFALRTAIEQCAPNFEVLGTTAFTAFQTISNTVTRIWGDMWTIQTGTFLQFTEENSGEITKFFENIIKSFTDFATLISDATGEMFADTQAWWESSGKPVYEGICQAISDVGKWLLEIYNTVIDPVIDEVVKICSSLWEDTLCPLWQNLREAISDVGSFFLKLWNNILKPAVDWIIKYLGPPISEVFKGIANAFGGAFAIIATLCNSIISIFRRIIKFVSDVFSGNWEDAWNGIVDIFKEIFNLIPATIETVINNAISLINGIISGVNGITGKVGIPQIPMIPKVSIPRLATGAVLPANKPFLAMVGDQRHGTNVEAPLETIQEAVAAVMADYAASNLAGQEATISVLREILEAILGIQIGDDLISNALERHRRKMAVVTGGSEW